MNDRIRRLLTDNIRVDDARDDDELRASLKTLGWISSFPAIKDERGVVLVGHRRLRIAAEEKIEPKVDVLILGDGDAADADRVKIALASNIGGKPLTPKDRRRIAEHLYGEREWTMERIGAALGVSHQTIGRDLGNLSMTDKSKRQPKTATNPKGSGRPKGVKARTRNDDVPPEQRDRIAAKVLDEGKTWDEVQAEEGVSATIVRRAKAYELGRRAAKADPEIDPATLSKSAQEKLAAAKRQMQRRLDAEFERATRKHVDDWLADEVPRRFDELMAIYQTVLGRRSRGIMKAAEFRLISSCLHPDSRAGTSERKLAEAFDVIQKHKLLLVDETTVPTPSPHGLPRTAAEWMAARQKRRAKARGVMR
jgi:ParB-like chromosome segregation protein Spo0J